MPLASFNFPKARHKASVEPAVATLKLPAREEDSEGDDENVVRVELTTDWADTRSCTSRTSLRPRDDLKPPAS
jgi:hypothetical protein